MISIEEQSREWSKTLVRWANRPKIVLPAVRHTISNKRSAGLVQRSTALGALKRQSFNCLYMKCPLCPTLIVLLIDTLEQKCTRNEIASFIHQLVSLEVHTAQVARIANHVTHIAHRRDFAVRTHFRRFVADQRLSGAWSATTRSAKFDLLPAVAVRGWRVAALAFGWVPDADDFQLNGCYLPWGTKREILGWDGLAE